MSQNHTSDQEPVMDPTSEGFDGQNSNPAENGGSEVDSFFNGDDRITELMAKLKAAETEVLKSHAEAENFRKRLQRDADQQLRYANLPLVRDMLDVIDNLKRATGAAGNDAANASVLLDGVKMVTQQLADVLTKYACRPIESVGKPFDPNFHEAIAQMPSAEVPAGSVAQEVAVGYTLHDRVIRPSQVIVSTGQ